MKIHSREEAKLQPPKAFSVMGNPVNTVFIHTAVTSQPSNDATFAEDAAAWRQIQAIGFGRGFDDISYSFGVAPSGRVFRGRGWRRVQAATLGYNDSSISIVTIGNTDTNKPTQKQLRSIIELIEHGQDHGHLTRRVDVRGHREVAAKACPGAKFTDATIAEIQAKVNGRR